MANLWEGAPFPSSSTISLISWSFSEIKTPRIDASLWGSAPLLNPSLAVEGHFAISP